MPQAHSLTVLIFSGDSKKDLSLKLQFYEMLTGYTPNGFPTNLNIIGGFQTKEAYTQAIEALQGTSFKLTALIDLDELKDGLKLVAELVKTHGNKVRVIGWSSDHRNGLHLKATQADFIKIMGKNGPSDRAWLLCKLLELIGLRSA